MTKVFDDKAREEMVNQFKWKDYSNIELNELSIKRIEAKWARKYIATFHYSKTFPDSTKFSYGIFHNKELVGVVCYGMGCGKNQFTYIDKDIQNGQYVELTRVWLHSTLRKNAESYVISRTLKMLPEEILLVVSFSDSSKGHNGTIYQATNWKYLGRNKGGKILICEDGIEKHSRLIGMYKQRNPHLRDKSNEEIMNIYGWKWGKAGEKHRYVFIRGNKKYKKKMSKALEDRVLPYPNRDFKPENKKEYQLI
ncbi:acetyltransferase [Bacillus phage Thornton]|uniref:Acetyltransferase n=1 Tax=Bacillus phage Thornton TaxID=2795746 RepID=A0A7T7K7W1_9CAUD|nr:Mom-like DNA modification protein [Bacillus phage Thornton]QQM15034.1 acetyltransferase [Bacillus phage Thornton]